LEEKYNLSVIILKNIVIDEIGGTLIEDQKVEIAERKGLGHPDFMIDSIMEEFSLALCREYLKRFGRILHHNVDKGDIIGGETEPMFGGGKVVIPSKILFSGRATRTIDGEEIPIKDIAITSAKDWIKKKFRFLDPEKDIVYQVETKGGSGNLGDIFKRDGKIPEANDTSLGIGYAPFSSTEKAVFELEQYLNSKDFKRRYPVSGEDVKVMGCRIDDKLTITVANSFIDRFVEDEKDYFRQKEEILEDIKSYISNISDKKTDIILNALDRRDRGLNGIYLTVTGTSAEMGDDGQVGRGNRFNGVSSYNRPVSLEAAAGKNPISHVGKIYNMLSHNMAEEIWNLTDVDEVYVSILSQIGRTIDDPMVTKISLYPINKVDTHEIIELAEDRLDKIMDVMNQYVYKGESLII